MIHVLSLLDRLVRWICIVLYVLAVLFALAGAVFRYLPALSQLGFWSQEATRYTVIWMVFLVSAAGLRRRSHVGVDLLVVRLPIRLRRIVIEMVCGVCVGFLIVVMMAGMRVMRILNESNLTSTSMGLPMGVAYFALPLGAFLMILAFIRIAVLAWRLPTPPLAIMSSEGGVNANVS